MNQPRTSSGQREGKPECQQLRLQGFPSNKVKNQQQSARALQSVSAKSSQKCLDTKTFRWVERVVFEFLERASIPVRLQLGEAFRCQRLFLAFQDGPLEALFGGTLGQENIGIPWGDIGPTFLVSY